MSIGDFCPKRKTRPTHDEPRRKKIYEVRLEACSHDVWAAAGALQTMREQARYYGLDELEGTSLTVELSVSGYVFPEQVEALKEKMDLLMLGDLEITREHEPKNG
jgi:hypothetical protein